MTQNYHDPIVVGESNSPATINTRLGTLDSAIGTTVASLVALTGALDDRIDDLIVDNGTSDAEVIAAAALLAEKVPCGGKLASA